MMRPPTLGRIPQMTIRAHPVRSLILVIVMIAHATSVIVGIIIVDSMNRELAQARLRLGADILVYPTAGFNQLHKDRLLMQGTPVDHHRQRSTTSRMESNEDIAALSYQIYIKETHPSGAEQWIIGIDPATDFAITPWLRAGDSLDLNDGQIIAGSAVDTSNTGGVVLFGVEHGVGARLEETGSELDRAVFVPIDALSDVIEDSIAHGVNDYASIDPNRDYSAALIRVADPAKAVSVANWINLYVRRVSAVTSSDTLSSTASAIGSNATAVGAIAVGTWLIMLIALGAAHTLLMNERRHEFEIWRAIGASRRIITRLVLIEALILAAAGAAIGVAIGTGGLALGAPRSLGRLDTAETALLMGLTWFVSVGIGCASAALAAHRINGRSRRRAPTMV